MMVEQNTRAIAYVRVSKVGGRFGDSFMSPTEQREKIEAWAKQSGATIVAQLEDLDVSGGTIDRPQFKEALAMIEAGQADCLVTAKLDRFARSLPRAYEAIERLEAAGATFVSVADQFDLSTPTGRLMFNVMASFAQFELERLTADWKANQLRAWRERGAWPGTTPAGYMRGEDGRLVPDPSTAPIVREALRLAGDDGPHAALGYLKAELPDRLWNMTTLRSLLERKLYSGNGTYNGVESDNPPEPLVGLDVWTRAQIREKRPRSTNLAYPLAHVARCGSCGGPLVGSRSSSRMYRCFNSDCGRRTMVSADNLESHTRAVLIEFAIEFGDLAEPRVGRDDDVAEAESALRSAELHRDEDLSNLELPPELLTTRLEAHERKIAAAQERYRDALDAAAPTMGPSTLDEVRAAELPELAKLLARMYGTGAVLTVQPGRGKIERRVTLTEAA